MSRIHVLALSLVGMLSCVAGVSTVALCDEPVAVAVPGQAYTVWPIAVDSPGGRIEIFQPQPESLDGDKLKARAAVSLTPPGATAPVFGAIWMTARVATDRDTRAVTILDVTVRRVRFPDIPDAQNQQFAQVLQQQLPSLNVTFSLDQLMASLDVTAKEKEAAQDLATTPPRVIVTTTPATLVLIDGQPQLQPVADQPGLMRVINSPFIILLDSASRRYFLKAGNFWYTAGDVTGPWQNVGAVPGNVLAEGNALTALPPESAPDASAIAVPPAQQPNPGRIIVSEEPAELIATDGPPAYVPLVGNDLLYVSNTQSDVFLEVATQQTYVLLSGRWYRAASLQGPWEYVPSDKLPAAFARIPADSPTANVLASVAGTTDAQEARIDAQIPQTAAVARNAGDSLSVSYDGAPQFEAIPQTPMSYCVNTPDAVLLVNGRYYCCHQAVWYESAVATGRWAVCLSVPDVIYTLPPSCPIYNVRYCYVYDSTPDVVYCGYTAGYNGCFNFGRTVVFGTGYFYHGWYRHEYFPRPCTWGFGVRYDPFVGTWGFGASARYDRNWFIHSGDHRGWWGPRGFINYQHLRRTDFRAANIGQRETYINHLNIYNRSENIRRKIVVGRNVPLHLEGREPGRHEPMHVVAPSHAENNIYAGHDGSVYRRTNEGWEQHGNNGWSRAKEVPEARHEEHGVPAHVERPPEPAGHHEAPAYTPSRTPGGLEAEHNARSRGADRARSYERPQQNDLSPGVDHPHGNDHPQGRR